MPALDIQDYQPAYLPAVLRLHRQALEAAGAYKGPGPWDDDLRDIPAHYRGGCFWLGLLDGSLVAMGALRRVDDRVCELKRMRTDPAWQGRGLGKTLLLALLREAARLGYAEIILETSVHQLAARRLYQSVGFEAERDELIDGLACTWFRKSLDLSRPAGPAPGP